MDMRIFNASEELAQILLKYGFTEITKNKFPSHHSEIIKNGYLPTKSIRVFRINSKDYVVFDYEMIKVYCIGECNDLSMKLEMTTNEIKSIIAFFKLPFQTRRALMKDRFAILTLYGMYDFIKENPRYHQNPRNRFIMNAFENLPCNF